MPVAVLVQLRHFYRDHHHHHHHHHYCSLYLRNDQQIWITTKIHIFTKGFKHIECGHFLRDHAGFHEHNEPRVVLDKLWHDIINSHTVTKHACTSRYNNKQTTKQTKAINNSYIYISHVNVTQTVPDISPLMPMHQDPLLVWWRYCVVCPLGKQVQMHVCRVDSIGYSH